MLIKQRQVGADMLIISVLLKAVQLQGREMMGTINRFFHRIYSFIEVD